MTRISFLLAFAALAACTVERAELPRAPRTRPLVSAEDSADVRSTILTLAGDLARGDLVALERIFDPQLIVFEAGKESRGWPDYRAQLGPALDALRDRSFEVRNLEMHIAEGMASVTFRYRFSGTSDSGPVSETGWGTAVLERRGGVWRIIHLHRSRLSP